MPESGDGESPSDAGADDSRRQCVGGTGDRRTRELLSRRRLLGASGVALASALAGCPGDGGTDTSADTEAPTDADTSTPTATATDTTTDRGSPTDTSTETETDTPEPSMEPVFDEFVSVEGTSFVVGGDPFYPVGGNHPQLRKQSEERQLAWIDEWTESVGPTNVLRATAFGTGTERPTDPLQPSSGTAGEAAFEKLDRLVALCGERGIRLVLPLANFWDWMGGIPQYLDWAGLEEKHEFYTSDRCQEWYRTHVETVLTRENTYTGIEYRDDPTIMMWELCNEPSVDAGARNEETLQGFYDWVGESARFITDLDSNHLVSTGMADPYPWDEEELNRRAHQQDGIDAYSLHLWADPEHSDIGVANGVDRIESHAAVADELDMPIYMGEFGWSIQRLTDDPDETYSIEYRNTAFDEFLRAMRREGYGGSLVWDFRHSLEFPLTWNQQAVFPRWDSTTSLLDRQYANFSSPPGESGGPGLQSASLSSETGPLGDRKTVTVPNTDGGASDEAAFSIAPEGDTYTDPDGSNDSTESADVSADVALGYDDAALHVRAEVADDAHEARSGSNMWQRDSIQVAVGTDGAYGPEFGISHTDGANVHRWMGGSATAGASAVEASTSRDESTTTYDLTFPWETLFDEARGAGDTFAFSVQINDNDAADGERDNVLGWTLPGINDSKQTADLGVLVLDTEGVVWDAQAGDGPGNLSTGETGTWTFEIVNYGDSAHGFGVAVDGADASSTIEVPSSGSATVSVEGSFADTGGGEIAVTVADPDTGGSRTISHSVTVV